MSIRAYPKRLPGYQYMCPENNETNNTESVALVAISNLHKGDKLPLKHKKGTGMFEFVKMTKNSKFIFTLDGVRCQFGESDLVKQLSDQLMQFYHCRWSNDDPRFGSLRECIERDEGVYVHVCTQEEAEKLAKICRTTVDGVGSGQYVLETRKQMMARVLTECGLYNLPEFAFALTLAYGKHVERNKTMPEPFTAVRNFRTVPESFREVTKMIKQKPAEVTRRL